MTQRNDEEQTRADNARLLRAWRNWHREQLEEALAGVHGAVFERLMQQLKDLRSARELIAFVSEQDWSTVSYDDRATALHLINAAICKLRERSGLTPIEDRCPDNRKMLLHRQSDHVEFPATRGKVDRTKFGHLNGE